MGLLTSWLSQMATDPEDTLKKLKLKAEVEKLKEEALLRGKPLWGQETPAARMPGGYAAAGDIPPVTGPTYGEAGARADIEAKSPLKSIIAQKGTAQFMAPYMQELRGPKGMEAISGQMYQSPEQIKWEGFLKMLTGAQKLEQAKTEKMPVEEEEVKPGEKMRESFTYTPGAKDLVNQLEIMMGLKEKEKQPTYGPISPGAGILGKTGPRAGEMIGVPITKTGKGRTGILGQYDEWIKAPKNKGKSFGDYISWKAQITSEARIKALDVRAKADPTYKKALDIAYKVVMGRLEEETMYGLEGPTDIEIVDRVAVTADDLYKKLKGERPIGRKDVLNIDAEIKRIQEEREGR